MNTPPGRDRAACTAAFPAAQAIAVSAASISWRRPLTASSSGPARQSWTLVSTVVREPSSAGSVDGPGNALSGSEPRRDDRLVHHGGATAR
ncbi:hypothetical protein [Actinomadura sp. 3N407]|uniref:hypothetical protein n=1 Tax=Actinomadura sp. 3N407 TaxID=3457423 RepID=UPI003FCC5589